MSNFTREQKLAIESRNRSLLVSAAAGSGKTTVLAERIIRKVCDVNNPLDLSRVLVVTFTRASAADLREKLSKVLKAKIKENPNNKHLVMQSMKLPNANISTIHGFCFNLIKQNFQSLGISPKVRVSESHEVAIMKRETMESVINSFYDGENSSIKDFSAFSQNITSFESELSNTLLELYGKLIACPNGLELPKKYADEYNQCEFSEPMESKYGQQIKKDLLSFAEYYVYLYGKAIEELECCPDLEKKFGTAFRYNKEFSRRISDIAKNGSYEQIMGVFRDYQDQAIGRNKVGEIGPAVAAAKDWNKDFKEKVKKFRDNCFSLNKEDIKYVLIKNSEICNGLYIILKEFDKEFTEKKKRYGILDFSDLERYSYELLYNEDGSISDYAASVRDSFDEIYIDEYQDTNRIQDAIFSAVSKENNRFMVGDVKQSIYSFRSAVPELFDEYRKSYGEYEESSSKQCGTVFMSKNFRCDKNIINFSNIVFDCLFKSVSSSFSYGDEDRLVYGKTEGEQNEKVKVCLFSDSKSRGDGEQTENLKEHEYVAREVAKLISQGENPRDIAILIRSPKKWAAEYENELRKYGIEVYNGVEKEYFKTPEILLALSLLNTVDNPTRDIYLAALLKSPLYAFSLDELCSIRLCEKDTSLYSALKKYSKENDFKKGQYFLEKLDEYREYAKAQSVDKLIWFLYRDTGLIYISDGKNSGRKNNLLQLYDFARNFEDSGFKGLNNFISKLDAMLESESSISESSVPDNSLNAVRLTTIHQSKGLEYSTCFICNCGKRINEKDLKERVAFSDVYGIGINPIDESGNCRYASIYRAGLESYISEKQKAEEMRILYVALTRAKHRLIITATVSDTAVVSVGAETLQYNMENSNYALMRKSSYIDWLLFALDRSNNKDCYTINVINEPKQENKSENIIITEENSHAQNKEDIIRMLAKRFDYKYPNELSSSLPAKIAVSSLYPDILDEDDTDGFVNINFFNTQNKKEFYDKSAKNLKIPQIMKHEQKASAADRGTATHVFMQFCDFERTEKYGIEDEILRLVDERFIPTEYENLIRKDMLERFFAGELFNEMKKAKQIWREVRFNIEFPASELTKDSKKKQSLHGENVIVQGVIDCIFIDENGKLHLLDYKTDKIPEDIKGNTSKEDEFLLNRHSVQLSYYNEACERILHRPCDKIYLYSFDLGRKVLLKDG